MSKLFIDGVFGFGSEINFGTKLLHKSKEKGVKAVFAFTPEDNVSV